MEADLLSREALSHRGVCAWWYANTKSEKLGQLQMLYHLKNVAQWSAAKTRATHSPTIEGALLVDNIKWDKKLSSIYAIYNTNTLLKIM